MTAKASRYPFDPKLLYYQIIMTYARGLKKPATKIHPERLIRDVEQHPDSFQHERAERFGCSQRGICEALKRLKISRGKNFFPSES
jgi:transposase